MARIVRIFHRMALMLAFVAAFVAFALDYTLVDVSVEPPEVVSVSGCVADCIRTGEGLMLMLDAREDVWLFFSGLPDGEDIGYSLLAADGTVLAQGEGCYLPIEEYPSAVAAEIYSLSGEADWSEVSEVHAKIATDVARSRTSALRIASSESGRMASAKSSAQGTVMAEDSGFILLDGSPVPLTLNPGTMYASDSVAGLSPENTTTNIVSIDDMLVSGNFPGHGAFSLTASGYVYVSAGESFMVGAD
ncbi:MAG: hypothetical protein IJ802_01660, partial [Kiritimatiellae bacterium]|nr:hypothetical protein [Kiritimatiellia bacterium]